MRRLIDLRLRRRGSFYESENPFEPVRYGDRVTEGAEFSELGLAITPQGADPAATALATDGVLFFANSYPDAVDFAIQPAGGGAEFSWVLRAPESREELVLDLDLPAGASLVETGHDAAEIRRGDGVIATISPPLAIDADPVEPQVVPVTLEVDGDLLRYTVDHQGRGFVYPIAVDPTAESHTFSYKWMDGGEVPLGGPFAGWVSASYRGYPFAALRTNDWYGPGLHIQIDQPSQTWTDPDYATWSWQAPGRSWIYRGYMNRGYRSLSNTDGAQPCMVFGLGSTPDKTGYDWYREKCDNGANYDFTICEYNDCDSAEPNFPEPYRRNNYVKFAEHAQGTWTGAFTTYAGQMEIYVADDDKPSIAVQKPTGWTNNPNATIAVQTTDNGVGAQRVVIKEDEQPNWDRALTYVAPCPVYCSPTITYAQATTTVGNLTDGIHHLEISAGDRAGQTTTLDSTLSDGDPVDDANRVEVKVDTTAPTIMLDGPGYEARDNLDGGRWGLEVRAVDGSPSEVRSGVASMQFRVLGTAQGDTEIPRNCTGDSCPVDADFTIDADSLSAGSHTVQITATDRAGNPRIETFQVQTGDRPSTSSCALQPAFKVYYLGSAIGGRNMNEATKVCESRSFMLQHHDTAYIYGDCTADPDSACSAPVLINSAPLCERHLNLYRLPDNTPPTHTTGTVKGVPVVRYDEGRTAEVYTGSTTITVSAATAQLVDEALGAIREAPASNQPTVTAPLRAMPTLDLLPIGALVLPAPNTTTMADTEVNC